MEAQTVNAKYVFIDVVNYTQRSVEAQSDVVTDLNQIVNQAVKTCQVSDDQILYIPTGDGICIALIDVLNPFDIHVTIGLKILELTAERNKSGLNRMRKFDLRVGINENIDNRVIDINGRPNLAGAGVNYAQRVMNLADPRQILIGASVYDKLKQREKYMERLQPYVATVKHGVEIEVYQLLAATGETYLNSEVPSAFTPPLTAPKELQRLDAYFLAYAIKYESFSIEKSKDATWCYSCAIAYFHLAQDSEEIRKTPRGNVVRKKVALPLPEYYALLETYHFWVLCDLACSIFDRFDRISPEVFESVYTPFITEAGKQKLKNEFPDIYEEFGFSY